MEVSNAFKESIKEHLDKRASEDELFAVTYKKENKSLDECCNYVMECAQNGGFNGYADKEVFGWAVHYYDEDDIKNIKPVSGKVIVNRPVELTEEDKAEVKKQAMERAIEEAKVDAKKGLKVKVELSEEEKSEAKQAAIEKVISDQQEKIKKKKAKKIVEAKPSEETDLFSDL